MFALFRIHECVHLLDFNTYNSMCECVFENREKGNRQEAKCSAECIKVCLQPLVLYRVLFLSSSLLQSLGCACIRTCLCVCVYLQRKREKDTAL